MGATSFVKSGASAAIAWFVRTIAIHAKERRFSIIDNTPCLWPMKTCPSYMKLSRFQSILLQTDIHYEQWARAKRARAPGSGQPRRSGVAAVGAVFVGATVGDSPRGL